MIAAALLAIATLASVRVDTSPAHRLATIRPDRAIGTAVDSDPPGKIALLYSPERVRLIRDSGVGTLTYRLYTELSIQDWHWNPAGSFSDAARAQGYWTGSAVPGAPILDSYGYRLPHRGSTHDQGDDDGYSRIDDGDPSTYWKSNPYLSSAFTGEPDAAHPQWVVIDLGKAQPVDAIRIAWADPYATRYRVQFWRGAGDAILDQANGTWNDFADGRQRNEAPSAALVRLAPVPVWARWVRVLMTHSSDTCDTHGKQDLRNCVGYAIADIGLGTVDGAGVLTDLVRRSTTTSEQTVMWTSSDDPWHARGDRVTADQDQPGLDVVSSSGITGGLPAIYPVPLFYSTPENAANEIRYLEARRYPIAYVEMGEEIDGQYALPEDYAALYMQFARAIHAVDPRLELGGPVFSGFNTDLTTWADASGRVSWFARFLDYLRSHGALGELGFMSFEHYPFKACDAGDALQDDLLREPDLVRNMVRIWRGDGLPANVPVLITEAGFASDGPSEPQRVEGALWTADYMASALSAGISYVTYYQAETEPLHFNRRCATWGAYDPFIVGEAYDVRAKAAAFYALQMLAHEWLQPGDAPVGLYPVATNLGRNRAEVTAYAAHRPDGRWSLLVVNKDFVARPLAVAFSDRRARVPKAFATFGIEQYFWSATSASELPSPDAGISHRSLSEGNGYLLPPRSISVIRF
ncbi:MAG TPA: discoidin domain-containing protein [Verrucomicrobiae bacterium]|nr:discoidin domain-containing protein [Verrucomicrobiae bacterium]